MGDREEFSKEFRPLVDAYLNENNNRNIAQLARKAQMSESTLRRAYNGQAVLNPENLYKILRITTGEKIVSKVIKSAPPALSSHLKKGYSAYNVDGDKTEILLDIEDHIQDFYKYIIIKRISHCDKIKRDDIKDWLGNLGLSKLDSLLSHEIVMQKDGVLSISQNAITLPARLYATHCADLIKHFFKYTKALENKSVIRNISDSVDSQTYQEIMNTLSEASRKIQTLIDNGPGDIPVCYVSMIDTMTFDEHQEDDHE